MIRIPNLLVFKSSLLIFTYGTRSWDLTELIEKDFESQTPPPPPLTQSCFLFFMN